MEQEKRASCYTVFHMIAPLPPQQSNQSNVTSVLTALHSRREHCVKHATCCDFLRPNPEAKRDQHLELCEQYTNMLRVTHEQPPFDGATFVCVRRVCHADNHVMIES